MARTDARKMRARAAVVAIAPVVLLVGLVLHPYIPVLTNNPAVAAGMTANPARWGAGHLLVAIGAGFLVLAFIAIRGLLREAGEERASPAALAFIVLGSTLFTMLPAMEIGMLGVVASGGDAAGAMAAMNAWFVPILLAGAVLFALGALGFAWGLVRSGVLAPVTTWVVVAALVVMAAARFVPLAAVQFYVAGIAVLVALWPLAYRMWSAASAGQAGQPGPMPAT